MLVDISDLLKLFQAAKSFPYHDSERFTDGSQSTQWLEHISSLKFTLEVIPPEIWDFLGPFRHIGSHLGPSPELQRLIIYLVGSESNKSKENQSHMLP